MNNPNILFPIKKIVSKFDNEEIEIDEFIQKLHDLVVTEKNKSQIVPSKVILELLESKIETVEAHIICLKANNVPTKLLKEQENILKRWKDELMDHKNWMKRFGKL